MADWHPEDIKAAVRKKGKTLAMLASDAGLSKQALSVCLASRASERGDLIIANFLGIPPQRIWPSRYRNGVRIRLRTLSTAEKAAA